jgi:hypothetical protein
MASVERRIANRIKSIVFINHLVREAGCARTPSDLERWGEAFEKQECGINREEPNGKWRRFLSEGRLPQKMLRRALLRRFPVLDTVLANRLWPELRRLDGSKKYRVLTEQLRMEGKPLQKRHLKRMQKHLTSADWRDLGLWLVILGSYSPDYGYVQKFIQKRFTFYFFQICVQPEFEDAAELLYELLDHHFRAAHLTLVSGWPTSRREFQAYLRRMRGLVRWLVQLAHGAEPDINEHNTTVVFGEGINEDNADVWFRRGCSFFWDADWRRHDPNGHLVQFFPAQTDFHIEGLEGEAHTSINPSDGTV